MRDADEIKEESKKRDIVDDRDIFTIDLTREQLMIALNVKLTKKQKNKLLHRKEKIP